MPTAYDLYLVQGQTETFTVHWKEDGVPVDMTGYTAAFHIRESFRSADSLLAYSTAGGQVVLDDAGNCVISFLPPATSALMISTRATVKKADGITWFLIGRYNVEVTDPSGRVKRLAEGYVYLDPELNR